MEITGYPTISIVGKKNYSILVTFSNGEGKIFDMTKDIQNDKFFYSLKDKEIFSKCKILGKGHVVCWNDDVDLASEYIYDNSVCVRGDNVRATRERF